jgi:hypothetical protein
MTTRIINTGIPFRDFWDKKTGWILYFGRIFMGSFRTEQDATKESLRKVYETL